MNDAQITAVQKIFQDSPAVRLAYLFGSQATGKAGVLSDYDFAVYLAERDHKRQFEIKLELLNELSRVLKSDALDVVVLNSAESPTLKYQVVSEGKLMYEEEPFRLLIEPRILSEYFDFTEHRARYFPVSP